MEGRDRDEREIREVKGEMNPKRKPLGRVEMDQTSCTFFPLYWRT